MKILYVINSLSFFISHRLQLAQAASNSGYEVHVAAPFSNETDVILKEGFCFHPLPLTRSGMKVLEEINSFMALCRLYRLIQPELVHHIAIKPVIYGGVAARLTSMPAVISTIPGLGHVFVERGSKAALLRFNVKLAYRFALAHSNSRVIFQNAEDRDKFVSWHLIDRAKTILIKGSGVDISQFSYRPEPLGTPVVLMASRMILEKGVSEFVKAAHQLRKAGVKARFVLAGDSDPGNPTSISRTQLINWHKSGMVEWWEHCDDMPNVFAQTSIVCLPSHYGEGIPKVLVEAAACGRAIVTTDIPGCRDVVVNNYNGILVPRKDPLALVSAIRRLLEDRLLRQAMGKRGREIAVEHFSLQKIVKQTLTAYNQLLHCYN